MADTRTTAEKEAPTDLLKQTQIQVDELLDISRHTVNTLMERGQKLSDLTDKSKNLETEAGIFINQTERIKRKNWMKQFKKKILISSILFIVLLVVILILIQTFYK